jgi:hypothetical protein
MASKLAQKILFCCYQCKQCESKTSPHFHNR